MASIYRKKMIFKSFKPTSNEVGFINPVVLCPGGGLLSGQLCMDAQLSAFIQGRMYARPE